MTCIIRGGVVGPVNEAWTSSDWLGDRRCGDGGGGRWGREMTKL